LDVYIGKSFSYKKFSPALAMRLFELLFEKFEQLSKIIHDRIKKISLFKIIFLVDYSLELPLLLRHYVDDSL